MTNSSIKASVEYSATTRPSAHYYLINFSCVTLASSTPIPRSSSQRFKTRPSKNSFRLLTATHHTAMPYSQMIPPRRTTYSSTGSSFSSSKYNFLFVIQRLLYTKNSFKGEGPKKSFQYWAIRYVEVHYYRGSFAFIYTSYKNFWKIIPKQWLLYKYGTYQDASLKIGWLKPRRGMN